MLAVIEKSAIVILLTIAADKPRQSAAHALAGVSGMTIKNMKDPKGVNIADRVPMRRRCLRC